MSMTFIKWNVTVLTVLFATAVQGSSATAITSGQQYLISFFGRQAGCADETSFMSYLNKTCSASGPVLRAASDGKTWTKFTLTKVGKSAQGEDLVEIQTYYPKSSSKPRCQGYVVPEKKDACREAVASKVSIQTKKGDAWALSAVKGKKDTYTIRSHSRKSGCLKYLAAAAACGDKYLQLDAKDDGSGRQHWIIFPVKTPAVSPPPLPQFVEIPAVNYSIAVTGYTKQSFGAPQQTAFCNSIYNSTTYPQDYMKCIVSSVSEVPYQGSSSSSGRKLAQSGSVYVRGYTAFQFIYGNNTSQQQAEDAADGLYKTMDSPDSLQTMFQSSFSSSTIAPDAVDRGEVPVPESTLPTPDLPSPSSPSPTPSSPSPTPASPTLSPTFNTVPGGDGVFPPVTSPVPVPTPVPIPTPSPPPPSPPPPSPPPPSPPPPSPPPPSPPPPSPPPPSPPPPSPPPPSPPPPSPPPPPPSTAFVLNFLGNSVSACVVSGGTVTSCGSQYTGPAADTFSNPYGIAISGSIAYIINGSGSNANTITACTISSSSITTCTTPYTGGSFSTPRGMALLTDSTGTTIYIVNAGGNSITACTVSGLVISNCATPYTGGTFSAPAGIAISGSTAYIVNVVGNSIVSCTVSGLSISACSTPFTASVVGDLNGPFGIAISGSMAYITNYGGNSIVACAISGGVVVSCGTPYTNGVTVPAPFDYPGGIAIYDSKAYITNEGTVSGFVSVCTISSPGVLSSCVRTTPTGGSFSAPIDIAIV